MHFGKEYLPWMRRRYWKNNAHCFHDKVTAVRRSFYFPIAGSETANHQNVEEEILSLLMEFWKGQSIMNKTKS